MSSPSTKSSPAAPFSPDGAEMDDFFSDVSFGFELCTSTFLTVELALLTPETVLDSEAGR